MAQLSILCVNRLLNAMCEIYKIVNGMAPEYLQLFIVKEVLYESKTVLHLDQPKVRTVLYSKESIRYEGATLRSTLLQHFKFSDTSTRRYRVHTSTYKVHTSTHRF